MTPTPEQVEQPKAFHRFFLVGTIYFGIAVATWPFVGKLWIGELPLLALWHIPKILILQYLRKGLVMSAIRWLGASSGSFSPDYILAGPYAVGIAYSIPLLLLWVIYRYRRRIHKTPASRWALVFFVSAALDGVATLYFGHTRDLSVY